MTTDDCISPERIEEVLSLPEGAPAREHLRECPRCAALLLTYREFIEDRSVPPGADLRDAERSLRGAVIGAPVPDDDGTRGPASRGLLLRLAGSLRGRRLAWILAPATLVLTVGLYVGVERAAQERGAERLRGPAGAPSGGAAGTVQLVGAFPRGTDAVELRWRAVAGASSYDVVIFGADLADRARRSEVADTVCVVRRSEMRPEPEPAALLGWQVLARSGGAFVARSPIGEFRIP